MGKTADEQTKEDDDQEKNSLVNASPVTEYFCYWFLLYSLRISGVKISAE